VIRYIEFATLCFMQICDHEQGLSTPEWPERADGQTGPDRQTDTQTGPVGATDTADARMDRQRDMMEKTVRRDPQAGPYPTTETGPKGREIDRLTGRT